MRYPILTLLSLTLGQLAALQADVSLPRIFGDHMVLQREHANPVWGQAQAGEAVTVSINGQTHSTTADSDGKWRLELDPMDAGGPYTMTVKGNNEVTYSDVLVGEVWLCSGQSNMQWSVNNSDNAAVEIASANNPEIRFMRIQRNGTQEKQSDIVGDWAVCSPETVKNFSAVGYFFGRTIQNTLGVPVGLIDNSWGGSSAEAWVPRDKLEADSAYEKYLSDFETRIDGYTDEVHKQKVAEWKEKVAEWEQGDKQERRPRAPTDPRYNQHGPANIYNGMVYPIQGYGIRGVIWYQGESNAGRAQNYQTLFPLVITSMREAWGQGDFPFYWVQLADYQAETDDPNKSSSWAELREAQTMTLSLPNTGEAVIIDVGEGRDIHPRNKQVPASRLSRWALANDYGVDMHFQSPTYKSMQVDGGKVTLTFDHVDGGLRSFDTEKVKGFAIAGEDQQFYWADAKIVGNDTIVVSSEQVPNPVAVRYAWAQNPVANVQDRNGLPLTPFRASGDPAHAE